MADEWLRDGDCDNCRRKKYCRTPCKAHKERFARRGKYILYWENVILGKGLKNGEQQKDDRG